MTKPSDCVFLTDYGKLLYNWVWPCLFLLFVLESSDRNSDMMKQEVTRLQEMLNRLDFKRKVCSCCIFSVYVCKPRTTCQKASTSWHISPFSGGAVKDGRVAQRNRWPDDLSAQPWAARLEAEAANCGHRRSSSYRLGAAPKLVMIFTNCGVKVTDLPMNHSNQQQLVILITQKGQMGFTFILNEISRKTKSSNQMFLVSYYNNSHVFSRF